jgi:redox-sensitive bicupin YhaK (pirin superfamily)
LAVVVLAAAAAQLWANVPACDDQLAAAAAALRWARRPRIRA